MNKDKYIYASLLLLAMLFLGACFNKQVTGAAIEDFQALDMPSDDGSGVMLKWKPLDKTHRIIQYNLYRGHSPDSLFLLGNIEVDPRQGVQGEYLFFYDKDYLPLVEFETAPAKLKKEKHQAADSPIYKAVPRDAKVLGTLLTHYNVMGSIKAKTFYNGSRRIELKEGDKSKVYAGYRLTQFDNIYANPIPDSTYYYSVIAVTETGRRLPAAKVQKVTPRDNRPDSTAVFSATLVKDKNQLGFEWSPPTGVLDIAAWQGWLMPKSALPLYRQEQAKNISAPDSVFYSAWQRNSIRLFETSPAYWSQTFYHQVDMAKEGIKLPANLEDYVTVLAFMDYKGYWTATLGKHTQIKNSEQLPGLPGLQVLDKKNDKGDNLIISFGKPFAYITQAAFSNHAKTKLRINYDISKNEHYDIQNIRFTFQDSTGKNLGVVKENYPDNIISLRLPKDSAGVGSFQARVEYQLVGQKSYDSNIITQDIVYDPSAMRFNGGNVYLNGQNLNKIYYDIFAKNKLSAAFSPGMRTGGISRSYDHTIPFEDTVTPAILKYDAGSGRLLLDPHFIVAFDAANSVYFSGTHYKQDFGTYLADLKKEIAELEKTVPAGDSTSENALQVISKKAELKFVESHPAYKQALSASNDRSWRDILRKEMDRNSRSYAYQVLATDGRGLWQLSDTFKADGKNEWNYPVGNWFDRTKLATLIASFLMMFLVVYTIMASKRKDLYIRPIAGLAELDNAVGRATEMGRPVMFVPGWGTLGDVDTIASMMILNQIAKKTAEYDIRLIIPNVDYFVVPLAQEMVQTAYSEKGRPDAYNQNDIFFVSDTQFAFCAAVNGITVRERVATIFYMGYFFAEALLMTETGNQNGAIQIAGTDATTQVPFFITTCDYTLIGEEFYAASAYLSRDHNLVSMLKAQDYFKVIIIVCVVIGVILSTLHNNSFLNFLPFE